MAPDRRVVAPLRRVWLARALALAGLGSLGAHRISCAATAPGGTAGTAAGRASATAPAAEPVAAPVSAPASTGMARRTLQFPTDHGAHPDTGIEWWYLTGWLAEAGRAAAHELAFGFQLTFFRARGPAPADHASRFAARQVLMAHAALTVLPAGATAAGLGLAPGRLSHDQRLARAGVAGNLAATGDTDVSLGAGDTAWRLRRSQGATGRSSYRADFGLSHVANGAAAPATEGPAARLLLDLSATQPPLLQGDAGWSRKGPAPHQASFYVSEPQLAATGSVSVGGRRLAVAGQAWLDHEWSDAILPADAEGWDWLGINLFDGSALTLFRLRQRTVGLTAGGTAGVSAASAAAGSSAAEQAGVLWAGGSWRSAGGASRAYAPGEVGMTALRHWRSTTTGALYPVAWRLVTPSGSYELRALLDAQELDARGSSATIYWEGLAELVDPASGRRVGLGYLELTGYAGRPAL